MPKIGKSLMGSAAEAQSQSSAMENVGVTEVELCNFSYKWIVENFSFRWEKLGETLYSPTFSGGGGNDRPRWKLVMYPMGSAKDTEGYVSLFLQLVSCDGKSELRAKFSFNILGVKAEERHLCQENSARCFNPGGIWGWNQYIKRDELLDQANGYLKNDDLTILCNVWIVADSTDISRESEAVQLKVLSDDMGHLLESKRFTDVTLVADGYKEFKVHKTLLAARSTVFATMFEHNMEGRLNKDRVYIFDVKAEALEEMIKFIYTGKCDNLKEQAYDLLAAANKYALEGLKGLCEEELYLGLKVKNAAEVAVFADIHSAGTLKARALDFIALHATEVMETMDWKAMVSSHPHLIVEAFEMIAGQTSLPLNQQSNSSAEEGN